MVKSPKAGPASEVAGQEASSLFTTLFSSLPLPMVFVNNEGTITFINSAYATYLKESVESIIGKNILDVIPNSRIPLTMKTGKAEFSSYHRYMTGPAEGQEAIVHRIPIYDAKGKLQGCCGIVIFQNMNDLLELTATNKQLQSELMFYQRELKHLQNTKYTINDIIGRSGAVKELQDKIIKYSQGNSSILILGESGSGKELVAHSIHNCSKRSLCPFVRLNCASIPENLFESEFFGYEPGAFTGATKNGKKGTFELANHGTLFLDEIGELPLYMQAKLLRVLQEKEITPIGGNRVIPVDVRIVAATNSDLEKKVEEGSFRADLYYRLNILTITVPPLRERMEDIHELTVYYLEKLHKENGYLKTITPEVMDILRMYQWEGNIRELFNVLEKMYFISDDDVIGIEDVPLNIMNHVAAQKLRPEEHAGLDAMIRRLEADTAKMALRETQGNISKAADILKISRPRLYRIIENGDVHVTE